MSESETRIKTKKAEANVVRIIFVCLWEKEMPHLYRYRNAQPDSRGAAARTNIVVKPTRAPRQAVKQLCALRSRAGSPIEPLPRLLLQYILAYCAPAAVAGGTSSRAPSMAIPAAARSRWCPGGTRP
jgi:hypothetical protein